MNRETMEALDKEDIVRLIAKYLTGNALEEEVVYLEEWMQASPANKAYFLQVKNVWDAFAKQPDISPEKALQKVLKRIDAQSSKHGILFYWQRVAAVLFLPLLVASLVWNILSNKKSILPHVVYNEVYAAFGTRSALTLSDGSKVWLNSGSSLKFPVKFESDQREVYLKGEGYFEVKSDVSKPFIVQTQSIRVKATGTKFNVMAFEKERTCEVSLLKGKVSVNKVNEKGDYPLISELKPNQHLVYDTLSGEAKLQDEDVYRYIAWKDGKLIFRNQPLSAVVKRISQLYNVDIELKGSQLQDYRYRATFQEESLSEILKLLKLSSPVDYKEVDRAPMPDASFPKKKIIIFPVKKKMN
ncbi:MAG: DUF4974 domain-containing protein [Bacteroidota bacterium]|nr:DUF4974 domain-containing protein [Bacteroidota bacterium]